MPMSPSPQASPTLGSRRLERHPSKSPVSQPHTSQSKRDRKRSLIRDTFSAMEEAFSANKDNYYRINLQKIQIDLNLIAAAETHGSDLLPNDPAQIEKLVRESIHQNRMTQVSAESLVGAGRDYAEFAKECNDAMEERDAALSVLHRDVTVKLTEIYSTYNYHRKLALHEYDALRTTIRDRLINSVTNKKARLTKEKEVDINETSSLLLHPSQYGIANPSSPGTVHSKRATRNRRDADETPSYQELSKRKRKYQNGDDSTLSARQRYENGLGVSSSWLAEKNNLIATQIESPLYSIEKLFTERELAMTYNAAAMAAYSYIVRHNEPGKSPNEISSTRLNTSKRPRHETASGIEAAESSAMGGHSMERQTSHANKPNREPFSSGFGIDAFDDVTVDTNFQTLTHQIPKLPTFSQSGSRSCVTKNDGINSPACLANDELANELELIRRARQINDQKGFGYNLQKDDRFLGLLKEAGNPKGQMGRERWIASDNRENLPSTQKSGKTRERDNIESSDGVSKKNS